MTLLWCLQRTTLPQLPVCRLWEAPLVEVPLSGFSYSAARNELPDTRYKAEVCFLLLIWT